MLTQVNEEIDHDAVNTTPLADVVQVPVLICCTQNKTSMNHSPHIEVENKHA